MIPVPTLKYLIANKVKDARVLLQNKRCPAAIYIAGYAIELALKNKICSTLRFSQGFPETRQELYNYLALINENNPQPMALNLGDIRNHDLNRLLFYSGIELRIKENYFAEWATVSSWNPECRYKKTRVFCKRATVYLKAVVKIIKEIN